MECFRGLRHLQDKLANGKSPHETSFGTPFDGPVIHLGAENNCKPITTKEQSRLR